MCVGLVMLTNITALTVSKFVTPHVWLVVPLSNHCISAVQTKMAMGIMELVQYHQHQALGTNKPPL